MSVFKRIGHLKVSNKKLVNYKQIPYLRYVLHYYLIETDKEFVVTVRPVTFTEIEVLVTSDSFKNEVIKNIFFLGDDFDYNNFIKQLDGAKDFDVPEINETELPWDKESDTRIEDEFENIKELNMLYLATDKNENVTVDDEGWQDTMPELSEEKPYLWQYESFVLDNGKTENSVPLPTNKYDEGAE